MFLLPVVRGGGSQTIMSTLLSANIHYFIVKIYLKKIDKNNTVIMECTICVSPFNRSSRKKIRCPSCDLSVCAVCVNRFCDESPTIDVQCMQCKHVWDTEFVVNHISRTFLSKNKTRVERLLIDTERGKLPETQYALQYDRAMNEIVKPEVLQIAMDIGRMEHDLETTHSEQDHFDLLFELRRRRRILNRMSRHLEAWKYGLRMTYARFVPEALRGDPEDTQEKKTHIFPCSAGEHCVGYVMSHDHKCGTCSAEYCSKCFQLKHSGTDCNKEELQSAKLIRESSKPCPKCAVRIHKIEGCDQMWCTQCRTAFSWNTGAIETHEVHNPHYYEWFRNNRINAVETMCDRRPVRMHLLTHLGVMLPVGSVLYDYFVERIRLNTHIRFIEIERHFSRTNYEDINNLDLRLRWLKKEITEKHLGTVLYKRRKETLVNARRVGILRLYVDASDDIFHRLLRETNEASGLESLKTELDSLMNYVNKCFDSMRSVYKMKMPVLRFNEYTFELGGFSGYLPIE